MLGVDKEVVKKGIAHHYKYFENQGDVGGHEKVISAEDYLEKLIQLPIDLPPIEAGHRINYIESLLDEASPYKGYATLIERGVGDNPRSLKRFINLAASLGRLADTLKEEITERNYSRPFHPRPLPQMGDPCFPLPG